jgi:predicted ATPase
VGRSAEVAQLTAAWEAVSGGAQRVLLVSGAAGIGKSRLTARLVESATQEGRPVLVGRCDAAELPYVPNAAALRSSPAVDDVLAAAPAAVAAELAPVLDPLDHDAQVAPGRATPGGSEAALYTAVTVVLRALAGSGPVLLVIENAERIDRGSSRLLRHVVARLPAGVLLVVCFRDPPGGRHPALLPLLGDVPGVIAERIPLGPLSEEDLSDLVRPTVPDVDRHAHRLWQHTGGNPFYAKEMASALAGRAGKDGDVWAVPVGIRDVLVHRLSSLSPASRDVLPVAAVLGASVDVELLAEVTRLPEEEVAAALDDAVAEGLLVESGSSWSSSYDFANDLVREALRSTLGGFRLRALHLGTAEALMSRPGRRPSAAIAAHLRAAGPAADPLEAARYSLAASDEFSVVHAWDEAIEHAEAAVRLLEGTEPPGARADAARRAGMLRLKSGRGYGQGVELLETALHQFLRAGDEESAGLVHSRLGGAYSLHHTIADIPRAL